MIHMHRPQNHSRDSMDIAQNCGTSFAHDEAFAVQRKAEPEGWTMTANSHTCTIETQKVTLLFLSLFLAV